LRRLEADVGAEGDAQVIVRAAVEVQFIADIEANAYRA
jgi:hypothetical protein